MKLAEGQIVSPSCSVMRPTVTLETKCWEHDWNRILGGEWLRQLAERNVYPFREKILMINNVKRPSVVAKHAERTIQQGWLTKYVIVEEHAAEALDFFAVTRESLGLGYPYSIAELVGVFLCRSDFLLHFAGDCMPAAASDWVSRSVGFMSQDPRIKVCSLYPGEDRAEKSLAWWGKGMISTSDRGSPINVIWLAWKIFASESTMNPIPTPRVIRNMEANSLRNALTPGCETTAISRPHSSMLITYTRTGRCHRSPACIANCAKHGPAKFPNGLCDDKS